MRTAAFATSIALALASLSAAPATAETVYVTGDRMLDVERGRYVDAPLITISDGKVVSVEAGAARPMMRRLSTSPGTRSFPA